MRRHIEAIGFALAAMVLATALTIGVLFAVAWVLSETMPS